MRDMMKKQQLRIVPLFDVSYPKALKAEKSEYSDISFQHGYGQLTRAGVTVRKGVKGKVTVDMAIETYDSASYKASTQEIKNVVTTNTYEHLDETEKRHDYGDWWFWLFSASGEDYQHYKEEVTDSVSISDQTITDSLTNNFSDKKQKIRVKGEFEIEGTSNIPTTAYLFVETLNITTSDGAATTVINTTPVAADAEGNTGTISAEGKLNIIPFA